MSFNIRYDNSNDGLNSWDSRKQSVCSLIKKYHPDIIGIQEALINQMSYIDSVLYDYHYIGVGRADGIDSGEFSGIFYDSSKFNLIKENTFWLSESPNVPSKSWDASLERICTHGSFLNKITKDTLHVFNTHFDHRGKLARKESAKLLLNNIRQLDKSNALIALMGDFNFSPNSIEYKLLADYFNISEEVVKEIIWGPVGTFNGFDIEKIIDERIDYIFIKNAELKSYRHLIDRRTEVLFISDHLPVLAKCIYK